MIVNNSYSTSLTPINRDYPVQDLISKLALGALALTAVLFYTTGFTACLLGAGTVMVTAIAIKNTVNKKAPIRPLESRPSAPTQIPQPKIVKNETPPAIVEEPTLENKYPLLLFESILEAQNDELARNELSSIRNDLESDKFDRFKNYIVGLTPAQYQELAKANFFEWAAPWIEKGIDFFTDAECTRLHRNLCRVGFFENLPEEKPGHLPFLLASPVYRTSQKYKNWSMPPAEYDPKLILSFIHRCELESFEQCQVMQYWLIPEVNEALSDKSIDRCLEKMASLEINQRWDTCLSQIKELQDEDITDRVIERFIRLFFSPDFFDHGESYSISILKFHLLAGQGSFYQYLKEYINTVQVENDFDINNQGRLAKLKGLKENNKSLFERIHTITFTNADWADWKIVAKTYKLFGNTKTVNFSFDKSSEDRWVYLFQYIEIFPKKKDYNERITLNISASERRSYFLRDIGQLHDCRVKFNNPNVSLIIGGRKLPYRPNIDGRKSSRPRKFTISRFAEGVEDWIRKEFSGKAWICSY